MKRMACNKSRWKAANRSKDWRIRRRRRRRTEFYVQPSEENNIFVALFAVAEE
jgi:hypothetical protein